MNYELLLQVHLGQINTYFGVFRKVNGIEKVIMPKLQNTERYILMEMDERVSFLRLK